MTPAEDIAPMMDPQKLLMVLRAVHAQVAAALWLSAGMIWAVAAVACTALGWRRPALVCGFSYSATLCFVANGYAQILGPAGCALALMGFLWPRGKPVRSDPSRG